jgi:hypothetical protein
MNELMTWLRFSEAEAVATRDGLFSRASGNPAVPRWLARILLQVLFTAKSENEKYSAQILSSSGIAVFVSEQNDRSHWTGMPALRLAGDGAWLEMRFYQSAGRSFRPAGASCNLSWHRRASPRSCCAVRIWPRASQVLASICRASDRRRLTHRRQKLSAQRPHLRMNQTFTICVRMAYASSMATTSGQ